MTKMNPRGWETLTEEQKTQVASALIDMDLLFCNAIRDTMDKVVAITDDVDFAVREIARYSPAWDIMRIREDLLAAREAKIDA